MKPKASHKSISRFRFLGVVTGLVATAGLLSVGGCPLPESDRPQPPTPDDHADSSSGATALRMNGSATQGEIETGGDADFFYFTASADCTYTISTGGGIDTYMHLYASNGSSELDRDDDAGSGTLSRIAWDARSSGRLYVKVRHFSSGGTGNYTVSVTESNCGGEPEPEDDHGDSSSGATALRMNGSATQGEIETGGDMDFFYFDASAGCTYTIATSGGIDTYLHLYASNGSSELDRNDDGGSGTLSRIAWDAQSSGRLYVKVRHFSSGGTGSYTVSVAESDCGGGPEPETTVIRVYDTSTDVGIVAQNKDGDELAAFGEKDASGRLLRVTGMSYSGDDGRNLTVWLGDDGLPEGAVTDSGWIIQFVNYTVDTVDMFVTDPAGSTTIHQGVELDDGAADALGQYAQSGKAGGAPKWMHRAQSSEVTLSDGLRIGSLGVSWFGCGSNVAQILAAGSGIPSSITSCVGALLSTYAHFTGNEVATAASDTLSVTSCALGGVGSCVGLGLTTIADVVDAANEWESYCAGDIDGDGVRNCADNCPNTPGGATVDANGCTVSVCGNGICEPDEDETSCPQDCDIAEVYDTIVSSTERIEIFAWDCGNLEDGDRVEILLNGQSVRQMTLTFAGEPLELTLSPGNNVVDIKALNEGSAPPNTACFTVTDDWGTELLSASWRMETNQLSRLLVIYQP